MLRVITHTGDIVVDVTSDAPWSPDVFEDTLNKSVASAMAAHSKYLQDYAVWAPGVLEARASSETDPDD